jgi:hypothetical protein
VSLQRRIALVTGAGIGRVTAFRWPRMATARFSLNLDGCPGQKLDVRSLI